MKNLTWQNPEQLFVAQELINKVKSKCCGIKDDWKELYKFVSKELPELAEYKDTLKNGEYEICVLVRLGFAPSEIGILTGRKLSDIANIRKRLLLKLSNREGSAKDFDIYMKEEF